MNSGFRNPSIYHMANADPPVGAEARRRNHEAKARAWHQHGMAVIDPNDITNDLDRQHVINMANKIYGERKGD